MKTITEQTVEKVVREALSEKRLKNIALQAMEDYVLGLSMQEGEKTAPADYAELRGKVKNKIRKQ